MIQSWLTEYLRHVEKPLGKENLRDFMIWAFGPHMKVGDSRDDYTSAFMLLHPRYVRPINSLSEAIAYWRECRGIRSPNPDMPEAFCQYLYQGAS